MSAGRQLGRPGGSFDADRLRRLYAAAQCAGYQAVLFGEEEATELPWILWRHDIDLELPAVWVMAALEADAGISSTYFFMTRSWFYNLFSREGRETVGQVLELGHAVALHCDLAAPREAVLSRDEVERLVEDELALVEAAYPGVFKRVVSFHNPPKSVLGQGFASFYSAYQPKFFDEVKYLSESNRTWRDGPPEDWFDVVRHPRLSILLHPVLWAYPGEDARSGMEWYLAERGEQTRRMLIRDGIPVAASGSPRPTRARRRDP